MSSVLETFLFLFESDAEDLEKGFDSASKSADGLADDVQGVADETEEAKQGFSGLVKAAGALAAAFISVGAARAVMDIAQEVDQLGKFTDMLDINIEKMDGWGQAIIRMGGDAKAFQGTIQGLNDSLVETSLTGTSSLIPFFNLLGISALDAGGKARDAFEVLPEIADSFEKLSKQESASLGQKMGFDEATIRLLQGGRREIDMLLKRQRELGNVTKEQAENSADFNDSMADMGQVFGSIGREIVSSILPTLTNFLDLMTDLGVWIRENSVFVGAFFGTIAAVIFAAALPAMISLAAATWAAIAPFLLIGLAVVAVAAGVALLADDIFNFVQGNDSMIGRAIEKWEELKEKAANAATEMADSIIESVTRLATEFGMVFDEIGKHIDTVIQLVTDFIDKIKELSGGAITKIIDLVVGDDESVVSPQDVPVATGDEDGGFLSNLFSGKMFMEEAQNSPVGAMTSGAISNQVSPVGNTEVAIGEVVVQTQAKDSESIVNDIRGELNSQIQTAINSSDDGVVI